MEMQGWQNRHFPQYFLNFGRRFRRFLKEALNLTYFQRKIMKKEQVFKTFWKLQNEISKENLSVPAADSLLDWYKLVSD